MRNDLILPRAPALVRFINPLARRLLGAGMRMGPNTLLTIRGRKSGQPRTFPIAVAEIDGRRYVISPYGHVNWTRNLRFAGDAVVRIDGRDLRVRAHELDEAAATAFFRDLLPRYLRRLPLALRAGTRLLMQASAPEILADPAMAARTRPVFELLTD